MFAGQGEQTVGMAAAYLERAGPVRELLTLASDEIAVDLIALLSRNDRRLHETDIAQPVMVAISLGLSAELLRIGDEPSSVAGHSLGELSAASVAGCMPAETAVRLACVRGALMLDAATRRPGAMLALHADDHAVVDAALLCGRAHGDLDLAAHNTSHQWVLSGSSEALFAVEQAFSTSRMSTGGAWHSRAMLEAEQEFLIALRRVVWSTPRCTWARNRDGQPVTASDDIPLLLSGQLTRPVRWVECMQTLTGLGVDRFVMVGPARLLRGICRENLGPTARMESASGSRALDLEHVA